MSFTGRDLSKIHLYGILAWLTDFLILRYLANFKIPRRNWCIEREKKGKKKSAQGAGLTEQTGEKQCTRRFPRLKPRFVFKDCCYLLPTGRLAIVLLLLSWCCPALYPLGSLLCPGGWTNGGHLYNALYRIFLSWHTAVVTSLASEQDWMLYKRLPYFLE